MDTRGKTLILLPAWRDPRKAGLSRNIFFCLNMWLAHKGSGREKCFLSKSRHQWHIRDMLSLETLARKLVSLLVSLSCSQMGCEEAGAEPPRPPGTDLPSLCRLPLCDICHAQWPKVWLWQAGTLVLKGFLNWTPVQIKVYFFGGGLKLGMGYSKAKVQWWRTEWTEPRAGCEGFPDGSCFVSPGAVPGLWTSWRSQCLL